MKSAFLLSIFCTTIGLVELAPVDGLGDVSSLTVDGAQNLPFNVFIGYQILLPGLRFNTYGVLKNWSAIVVFVNSSNAVYEASFQVWRPIGAGKYKLVGFDDINRFSSDLSPIASHEINSLAYYKLENAQEHRSENNNKEENNPLYFQPDDVIGVNIRGFAAIGNRQLYLTYRNRTAEDPDHLVMDMYVNTTNGVVEPCEISTCSTGVVKYESIIPNIFFNYEELTEDKVNDSTTNQCDDIQQDECPDITSTSVITAKTSSSTSSSTSEPTVTDVVTTPTLTSTPQANQNLLMTVAVSAAGVVIILILGGVFIMIVGLAHNKRKALRGEYSGPPREAANALYREIHEVDEPTAYASTYRLKNGVYLDHESNAADPSTPHFSIRTEGSVVSLTSHNGRPHISLSNNNQSGAVSIHQILTPGETGAMSMQIPRSNRNGGGGGGGGGGMGDDQRRSLRVVSNNSHQRPPIPTAMQQPPRSGNNARRGSMPLKSIRDTHRPLCPGKSMPALSSPSESPSPFPCPPTPLISDPPVPYLTPARPWYTNEYERTTSCKEKERVVVPTEEGLYVPTKEEGSSITDDYSRLRHPHHTKNSNSDVGFFDSPEVFNEPATSTNEIYQQLSNWNTREIIRKYITVEDQIGSGHFATVCRCMWQRPGGEEEVAVKELKCEAMEEDRVKFLQEAAIMSQFNHRNVVRLHGIVTIDEPLLIVMELMQNGDLKNYLHRFVTNRRSPRQRRSVGMTPPPSPDSLLPITPSLPHQFLSFCRQVADGMDYLSKKKFVHRDLAARNIFLTKNFTCKIGDFGLARDLGRENLYQSSGGKIPIKWTAPEALQYRHFTSASDVWSYGMVLFEIWSLGHRPFDACTTEKDQDVMDMIGGSTCQPPPPGCPREMYRLMTHCWHSKPINRPSFSFICEFLSNSDSGLLQLPSELPSSISPLATEMGAPLREAKGLYSDLQYRYEESIV